MYVLTCNTEFDHVLRVYLHMHLQARVSSGAVAGLLALTCVYPFDVIRRRMQTHQGGAKYPSVWDD